MKKQHPAAMIIALKIKERMKSGGKEKAAAADKEKLSAIGSEILSAIKNNDSAALAAGIRNLNRSE